MWPGNFLIRMHACHNAMQSALSTTGGNFSKMEPAANPRKPLKRSHTHSIDRGSRMAEMIAVDPRTVRPSTLGKTSGGHEEHARYIRNDIRAVVESIAIATRTQVHREVPPYSTRSPNIWIPRTRMSKASSYLKSFFAFKRLLHCSRWEGRWAYQVSTDITATGIGTGDEETSEQLWLLSPLLQTPSVSSFVILTRPLTIQNPLRVPNHWNDRVVGTTPSSVHTSQYLLHLSYQLSGE